MEVSPGRSIKPELLQQALVERLDLPGTEFLPEKELSATQIVAALEGYKFPRILERIETAEPFLPSVVLSRLDEERRRQRGEIWELHKTDVDVWPSDPYAHNVKTGYKLDFRTGDLYDPRKKRADS
jgi:hypothetical protein